MIKIDIPNRQLAIIGVKGEEKTTEEIEAILALRRAGLKPRPRKYRTGVLRLYAEHAASPMKGAYMNFDD